MHIYAGIDEAGYGPMFGPLVVGRSVFVLPELEPDAPPPPLWRRLSKAVCRRPSDRRRRLAVNDSKKLLTAARGLRHLELACLAFARLAGQRPNSLDRWLDGLGERDHHDLEALPWYEPTAEHPWDPLPTVATAGEVAVAGAMLRSAARSVGVQVPDVGAAVVFEDRFNQMVEATRSKASTSFTFVGRHLVHVWKKFGQWTPNVVVDHQGARTRYRELLAADFPDAHLTVMEEIPQRSVYRIDSDDHSMPRRSMVVRFEVGADEAHMPVALASMIAKYTRELLMARFKLFFSHRVPKVRPTAGYARDAKRFWSEIQPHLPALAIRGEQLCRRA